MSNPISLNKSIRPKSSHVAKRPNDKYSDDDESARDEKYEGGVVSNLLNAYGKKATERACEGPGARFMREDVCADAFGGSSLRIYSFGSDIGGFSEFMM